MLDPRWARPVSLAKFASVSWPSCVGVVAPLTVAVTTPDVDEIVTAVLLGGTMMDGLTV